MGSVYSSSRLVRAVSRLPVSAKKWLLKGLYLRWMEGVASLHKLGISIKHINAFPRLEALRIMVDGKKSFDVELEIIDTNGFTGSDSDRARYRDHLERMTYIICPRGIENFSIRVYEALQYGRIPVIIDTEMVLPSEIDWDVVSLKIPYDRIDTIFDVIRRDYCSRSSEDFMKRQQAAFAIIAELQNMQWLRAKVKDAVVDRRQLLSRANFR